MPATFISAPTVPELSGWHTAATNTKLTPLVLPDIREQLQGLSPLQQILTRPTDQVAHMSTGQFDALLGSEFKKHSPDLWLALQAAKLYGMGEVGHASFETLLQNVELKNSTDKLMNTQEGLDSLKRLRELEFYICDHHIDEVLQDSALQNALVKLQE